MVDFGTMEDLQQGTPSEEFVSGPTFGNPEEFGLGSNRSLNERLEGGDGELKGVEAALAAKFPNIYGGVGVTLDMIPYAKYALPSEREKFDMLDQEEQTKALLWDAFGATFLVGAPVIMKGVGKGAMWLGKELMKPFTKVVKPLPIEDALAGIKKAAPSFEMKPFNFREVMQGKLQGKGMHEREALAVVNALEGNEKGLINAVVDRQFAGRAPTKVFNEATKWVTGKAYPEKILHPEFKMRYGEALVRGQFYNRQFESALKNELLRVKGAKPVPANLTQAIFDNTVEKLWPDQLGKMSFATMGEGEMANVVNLMLSDKAGAQSVLMAGMKHLMPLSWMPARVAFGTGEGAWGTISSIYNPTKALFETTNRYHFNKILEWATMLEQRGLATVERDVVKGFSLKKLNFTAQEQKLAYDVLRKQDDLMYAAVRGGDEKAIAGAREQAKQLAAQLPAGSPSRELVSAWHAYSDKLYSEYMIHQIPRVFGKARKIGKKLAPGFSGDGMATVQALMRGIEPKIKQLFATSSSRNATEVFGGIREVLDEAKLLLSHAGPRHPYLPQLEGEELKKMLGEIGKALTPRGKRGGDFLPYLENYTARMAERQDGLANSWRQALLEKVQAAGFTKSRMLETFAERPVDFATMIEARTYAQAKELFLYDGLAEVVGYAKGLPPAWAEYTEHWISRALNRPSITDHKTAAMLQKSIGSLERMMGKPGLWDEHRVMRLAGNVNNVTYMGALGFKPFSVIRNLFQPLLLVPADLGGLKDLGTLARGAARAMQPEMRKKLVGMNIITDYAPEITMRPSALPFGKPGVFGMSAQRMDQLRDVSLWMFRGSDRWNRYVTGASALTKWEGALGKVGLREAPAVFPQNSVEAFSKAINLRGRHPWKTQEIKDLLWRGKHDEAMATYIRDVVADTQYLYGGLDAPVITGRSAVGRTGFIFQTWWMNYLTTMEKWVRTGSGGTAKANRLLTGMLSAAIAEQLMEPLWGRRAALRAVGLGPIPGEISEFTIPPAWTPIYHGVSALANMQDPKISGRHIKSLLSALPVLVPGGLQASQMLRGAKKEGFEGFLKSIVRYQPDEEE